MNSDNITRFFFDNCNARGEIVSLEESFIAAAAHQDLPLRLRRELGNFLTAASLLTGILKFEGKLTLQAQGNGPVTALMAEATDKRNIRGIVRLKENSDPSKLGKLTLPELLGKGLLSITIEPEKGQRYQGIIPLSKNTLAENLGDYFFQSEQLPSFIYLTCNGQRASGLMVQALPANKAQNNDEESWETVEHLARTIRDEELIHLSHAEILARLFHELETRVLPEQTVKFNCTCSYEKSGQALISIGKDDAHALLAERDLISINCEFCGMIYKFGEKELAKLFKQAEKLH